MVGYYKACPYYFNQELLIKDGCAEINYGEIHETLSEDDMLIVYFSEGGWEKYNSVDNVMPRVLPLVSDEEVYYPLDSRMDCETVSIGVLLNDDKVQALREYTVYGTDVKEEDNIAFRTPSSACYVYGEKTKLLAGQLWESCGEKEEDYVESVYQYLSKMAYDYEKTSVESTSGIRDYCTRMDLDTVLEKNKAICREKANITAALLRLKGIPCKVCVGIVSEEEVSGHAWNSVYINNEWVLFDTTVARSGYIENERKLIDKYTEYWCY